MRNTILATVLFGAMVSSAAAAWPGEYCKWSGVSEAEEQVLRIVNITGYATPEFNPSVPVGTVLHSVAVPLVSTGTWYESVLYCQSGDPGEVNYGRITGTVDPRYNTFPTTVSGIGVRIRRDNAPDSWWPRSGRGAQFTTFGLDPLRVEFVKTGPITAAGSLRGEIGGVWFRDKKWQAISYRILGSIQIRPKVPTCSVATKQISVKMNPTDNNFTARDFGGIGGTTPERDFSIQLNCSGGDEGTSTNAYVTLTDNSNSGNRSNLLSLTPDSKASGVAVQILKDGTPLSFGPDSSAPSNPNQWKAGNIPQGQGGFTIPLTARYIQTGTLKGGTANAVATFTMSYQ
ncbi:fimbrial protein [Burkholderia cepacia]|uniref:fimbrial protein n=1 Tax=Burkholderia cepacia TaxID=292 RepID=UPI002AB76BE2|nr:fimbrial protein [Burkholderia cepacia]